MKRNLILFVVGALAYGQLQAPEQEAINRISADSMRANLSYLASDALEGRGTPSRGLDLAADYIAKQFRKAGLEPGAGDNYFQAAKFEESSANMEGFRLALRLGGQVVDLNKDDVRVRTLAGLDFTGVPVTRLPANGAIPPIAGMIVAGEERRYGIESFLNELQARKPALILLIGRTATRRPPETPPSFLEAADGDHVPVIRVRRSEAAALLGGGGNLTVSLHLAPPLVKESVVRNVAAVLRGSDPALRDQYVLVTAHYDHLGRTSKGIFYGANDDGSGTVSVIEIARALGTMDVHPKRSILFVTLFGEEEGLLGSYYYAHHPLVPLRDTVADINLEQMGRTDEQSGREVGAFAFTGPSFSNLPAIMGAAAKAEGVGIYRKSDADDYFDRSDNYAFAQYGIVAHTVAVAFEFPDYHALGDRWEKVDFNNMARVDRGVAAGVLAVADNPEAPRWSNASGAAAYRDAGR